MRQLFDFEEIRPLYDEEVPAVIESLLGEERFQRAVQYMLPGVDYSEFSKQMTSFRNKRDFQTKIISPFLHKVGDKTTNGFDLAGLENVSKSGSYTYISNHRDIILDASFLNILLIDAGYDTSEIAIGDNLLIYPWISNLVRLNKSFIVKRDVSVRQMLEVSKRLSTYIHFVIKIKHQSVWIAQREGRAKNSDDKTQESLLKMLNLGGGNTVRKNMEDLNITPLSISYEYDPCDYLKAKEFQMKRDDPDFKKSQRDDLFNMETGLLGFKGNVHFQITPPITEQIANMPPCADKIEEYSNIAQMIDKAIHANYRIYSGNYVALDLLNENDDFAGHYTPEEKQVFLDYLQGQIDKIDIANKDYDFLRSKILEMYANPLKNHLLAVQSPVLQ